MKPDNVNILGKMYSITYCDNPSDVDIFHRKSVWGQIDYWTNSIRVYDNGRNTEDILHTIMHEVLHGITQMLKINTILNSNDEEDVIDLLALGLADVLRSNDWLKE